ncbi:MAG TPA: 5-formyltetrahydrofolate cyclo-ligase [Gammaproteobacteria bacterium]|nr:5-formyltetrahydrofolate cyclo-ligase [Gammaproteobacteria bacterium]HBX26487.1 5-formyltetrahydrofolate cyclo-ligase [Gammaproteobacteria bacterium]
MSKQLLRTEILKKRDGVPPYHRARLSKKISDHLIRTLPANDCRVGSYMSIGSEVDLTTLHNHLFTGTHHCFVPRILTKTSMELAYLRNNADIIIARFGIRTSNQQVIADIDTLDWLIMPCVAYDPRGYRLGMGGGYYDRALEKCAPKTPIRIGVAFNLQETRFECDEWDQSLDWIVTENGIIRL